LTQAISSTRCSSVTPVKSGASSLNAPPYSAAISACACSRETPGFKRANNVTQ
jgi:hypothetical protein